MAHLDNILRHLLSHRTATARHRAAPLLSTISTKYSTVSHVKALTASKEKERTNLLLAQEKKDSPQ
jgi:hypothetical protein